MFKNKEVEMAALAAVVLLRSSVAIRYLTRRHFGHAHF